MILLVHVGMLPALKTIEFEFPFRRVHLANICRDRFPSLLLVRRDVDTTIYLVDFKCPSAAREDQLISHFVNAPL